MSLLNKKKKVKTQSFLRSKEIMAGIVVILSAFFIVGTFAWFTSSDYKINQFRGTRLAAEITEEFYPNMEWRPEETTKKEVCVKNIGESDAFVRVSLYEFLLLFQVDTTDRTGNGNLKTVEKEKKPIVDSADVNTWENAAELGGSYTWYSNNYVASQAVVPDVKNEKGYYQLDETDRNELLKKFKVLFGNVVTIIPNSSAEDYWLYEDGYFYYSRPLKAKEQSDRLLNGVSLNGDISNKYKGSLYQMKIFMDAHDLTSNVFTSWGIKSTDQVNKLLGKYLE